MTRKAQEETSKTKQLQDYLGEFVYGGIDGSVTTFAVVAGAAGADLSSAIVLILGFANLLADGFAMSVGAYLSTRSEQQNYDKYKAIQVGKVTGDPDNKREELKKIYGAKGFEGELLDQVVDVISKDEGQWVDTVMKEELEMIKESRSAFAIGATTFGSFILVGFIPLIVYVKDYINDSGGDLFFQACVLTSLAFITIGFLKAIVTKTNKIKGIAETLFLGAVAAAVAYYVGHFLDSIIS